MRDQWKVLKNMIHGVDVVVEVLDARDVPGTRLPVVERFAGSRRLLMVANKSDLLPEGAEPPKLTNKGIAMSAKKAEEKDRVMLIHAIVSRADKRRRPIHALFIGYPNVGKSSLINMLARRQAAKVSAVAGTTKNIQWVHVNNSLLVSDYRGVYPSHESEKELARKSAINLDDDKENYAYIFAEKILKSPVLRNWLEKRYDLSLSGAKDSEDVLRLIAERRKWFLKGGEPNISEAAKNLLRSMMEAPEIG